MNDYKCYIERMSKAIEEKLFFTSKLDLHNKTIIDFGCANGEVISHLASMYKDSSFIGIDKNTKLLRLARKKCKGMKNVRFVKSLDRIKANHLDNVVMICSSVLHELEDYQYKLMDFVNSYCSYLVVRDMYFNGSVENEYCDLHLKVREKADFTLKEFEDKYGTIENIKNLYHYLLKYSYKENWKTELQENYFSAKYWLIAWYQEHHNWKFQYINTYTLQFKKDQVKKDFDIELKLPTHIQIIMKIR